MPRMDLSQAKKDIEGGRLKPVYWLYGSERMKKREIISRIRSAVIAPGGGAAFQEEKIDGTQASGHMVVDAAKCMCFGGGTRLVLVSDAGELDELDSIEELFSVPESSAGMPYVCVFMSETLDMRRKISKQLVEKAVVVACEAVAEQERDVWIAYLSKKHGFVMRPEVSVRLRALEPWNLDVVEREIEKLVLSGGDPDVISAAAGGGGSGDVFVEAFFGRDLGAALPHVRWIAGNQEEALPLLGLLAWNLRQLVVELADGNSGIRRNPYLEARLSKWKRIWNFREASALETDLQAVDHGIKQSYTIPLGFWSRLVTSYCRRIPC